MASLSHESADFVADENVLGVPVDDGGVNAIEVHRIEVGNGQWVFADGGHVK